ncbi:divalent-cation tolerance protein CutA [Rhodovulum sulfidophilum]|uniref:divalent-cation tolerance protein CutA n=1 Tax=Rhodovulum sulfidophilum TaxID=35806 RepID=UPI001389A2B2|nr:divalent-cation tolerance protein CutA [Rhodovulum sulfidophilum]NDK34826.1 divalent-cation tolerance protein CutA [Rhodovulum sulfidophilum]
MIHVTTTCPDTDTARAIARAALGQRLAACANILPGVLSLFHWQGRIEEEAEVLLSFKTRAAHRPALVALIEERHPYDLPVIHWEDAETTPGATAWLDTETG